MRLLKQIWCASAFRVQLRVTHLMLACFLRSGSRDYINDARLFVKSSALRDSSDGCSGCSFELSVLPERSDTHVHVRVRLRGTEPDACLLSRVQPPGDIPSSFLLFEFRFAKTCILNAVSASQFSLHDASISMTRSGFETRTLGYFSSPASRDKHAARGIVTSEFKSRSSQRDSKQTYIRDEAAESKLSSEFRTRKQQLTESRLQKQTIT